MKDKSVAVIVNGCIRDLMNAPITLEDFSEYKRIISSINALLQDFKTVHIYYHTWNPCPATNVSVHEYAYNKEKFIEEFQSLPNIHTLLFENQYTAESLDALQAPYTQQAIANNYQYKQTRTAIYNCFLAFHQLCTAVKSSGIAYDYILRMRNDLLIDFANFSEIVENADNDMLCMPPNTWCFLNPNYTNDHWLFGKAGHILTAFSDRSFDELKTIVASSWNQEEATNTHYRKTNCKLFTAPVTSYVIIHYNRKFV